MKNERMAHFAVTTNRSQEHHNPVLHRELEGLAYELDLESEVVDLNPLEIQIEENKVYEVTDSIKNLLSSASESVRSHKILTAVGTAAAVVTAGVLIDHFINPKTPTSVKSSV